LARPFAAQNRTSRVPPAGQQAAPVQTMAGATPAPSFISSLPLVELTGGEPLLQAASLPLMKSLCEDGFTVLLETSGALDIAPVDPRVRRIMDLKCPSSGENARNRWGNLAHLKGTDRSEERRVGKQCSTEGV